eukprot:193613-Pleurochrysis_carterae.AAC.1
MPHRRFQLEVDNLTPNGRSHPERILSPPVDFARLRVQTRMPFSTRVRDTSMLSPVKGKTTQRGAAGIQRLCVPQDDGRAV